MSYAVRFSSDDMQASLPANYTFTGADAGVHTFAVTLKTAGVHSITVATTNGDASGTQTGIAVAPTVASSL